MHKFKLSDEFVNEYANKEVKWGPMGEFTYLRTYSRLKEDGSKEQWFETVRRVVEGSFTYQKRHCDMLRLEWNNSKSQKSAKIMYDKIFNFKFLPPGRGLWLAGSNFVDEHGSAALNNCFSGDTEFITDVGTVAFKDAVGKTLRVLTKEGAFEYAKVVNFGKQELVNLTLRPHNLRTNHKAAIEVTANHRWILSDGSVTTNIKVGDKITVNGNSPVVDKNSIEWQTGFAHGLIYGDGTRHTYYPNRHFIKVCDGRHEEYNAILKNVEGYHGIVYSKDDRPTITIIRNENWKALPDHTVTSAYKSGFIHGWLSADSWEKPSGSVCLDTIYDEAATWIINESIHAGYAITGISVNNSDTNFGKRTYPLKRISMVAKPVEYVVESITTTGRYEDVFCVTEPKTQSFTLAGGILTGNCAFISTEDIKTRGSFAFTWTMDALMLGVGVGFDTKGADMITIPGPSKQEGVFMVPDSREGWVESLQKVLDAYLKGTALPSLDYSLVRPYGTPIKGFGGVASGPEPLETLHKSVANLLTKRIGDKIKSTDIVDIMNMIGKCVVAGNVRRSAEIAIGNWDDTAYTTMKDYNLYPEELQSHRWASNNSVFAEVGKTDYSKFADSIALNGEPGLVWLDHMRAYSRMGDAPDWKDEKARGTNPCGEQTLESGELCCLVETFPSLHESEAEYMETLKYAYLYAKSVTLVPTHWPETNAVLLKNRRIGLSQSGIIDAFVKHGRTNILYNWCRNGYDYIQELDKIYSDWLCIPRSKKTTSIKPSGSVSLLAGVSPGIHYPHAEYYIRRIRVATESPLVKAMRDAGYQVEFDVYGDEDTRKKTSIIHFPIHEQNFVQRKEDVSIWEQVKNTVDYQKHWADNNVSVTVTFKKHEVKDIVAVLEAFESELKSISFLPISEHGYAMAPYEEITKEKYDEMVANIKGKPDFSEFLGGPAGSKFCDGEACEPGVQATTKPTLSFGTIKL